MLEPQDRRMLLEMLRPPPAHQLDFALGTTYSLDLLAMLTAPLGFTFYGLDDAPERVLESGDALLVLQTLRRFVDRIAIFCQAGRIAEPRGPHLLFSLLEESVLQVTAPIEGGVFHPKVWVLRFTDAGGAVTYRVLCLSRNLTFDKSWDTALVLDGPLVDRKVAYARNHPLADFVAALPSLCIQQPVSSRIRDAVEIAADELRRVDFEMPPGIDRIAFWPLGLSGKSVGPFSRTRIDRLMVVSPFLSPRVVRELGESRGAGTLISTVDELQRLSADDLAGWREVYAMNPTAAVQTEETASGDGDAPLTSSGLHAKLYVGDAGWEASVWTGSANATNAGLLHNVEFLVELTGKRTVCGIDALLARADGTVSLRDLLESFVPLQAPVTEDATSEQLKCLFDAARDQIAGRPWRVGVNAEAGGGYRMRLRLADHEPLELAASVGARCWPITLPHTAARPLTANSPVDFGAVSFEAVTSFIAVELTASVEGREQSTRFVLNALLDGAPAGRMERLLQSLLRDRRQVLRFLLLLLSADEETVLGQSVSAQPIPSLGAGFVAVESEALLEPLLRALERDPARLDQVHTVIKDLTATEEGRQLLPEGLSAVWEPIWTARRSLDK